MTARRLAASILAFLPACLSPGVTQAQGWTPSRNIEFIVPAGAGAALDTVARQLKETIERTKLSPTPLVVSNRPGGADMVAMNILKGQPGNAHYLMSLSYSALNGRLVGEATLGYDDLTPVALLLDEYIVVAVRDDSPIRTGRDLVERLRRDPASLSIGVAASLGNHIHVAIAKPLKTAGVNIVKLTVVPFKSSAESLTNLLGGHLDVVSASAINVIGLANAGKIRVIAVAAAQRLKGELASVPTWTEQGVNASYSSSQGIMAPKGLTPEQIRYWEGTLRKVSETPEWSAFLARNQWTPHFLGHAETMAYLNARSAEAKAILGELGLLKQSAPRQP